MKNKIFLIEDHDQALKVWRREKIKGLDLVHIDAHMDFGFHQAKPIKQVINGSRSIKELKNNLEKSIMFMRYEKDFNKQTNIGNFIYPAMEEGIVKNFYWVVPGSLKEFKNSAKFIKNIFRNIKFDKSLNINQGINKGIISFRLLGRKFFISTLKKLPVLKENVLLDIDTDFLVIDSILNADNTKIIGKRKPWILPEELVGRIKEKIKNPRIITIAYSVNGGYTPMKYKHFGDEIACNFSPERFNRHFYGKFNAAKYFSLFLSEEKKEYYQKAVKLNPAYRVADNNYGPLYLTLRKFSLAQREFCKILRVDPENPACILGLGNIALARNDFKKAKKYFSFVLSSINHKLFTKEKNQSSLGLAQAEFSLKNFKIAKKFLKHYIIIEPLQPYSYYLLGEIFAREKDFKKSAKFYQDAIKLGFNNPKSLSKLLKISCYLKEKDGIIKFVRKRFKELKKGESNARFQGFTQKS